MTRASASAFGIASKLRQFAHLPRVVRQNWARRRSCVEVPPTASSCGGMKAVKEIKHADMWPQHALAVPDLQSFWGVSPLIAWNSRAKPSFCRPQLQSLEREAVVMWIVTQRTLYCRCLVAQVLDQKMNIMELSGP